MYKMLRAGTLIVLALAASLAAYGRDDLDANIKYGCTICDDSAYVQTNDAALVFIHAYGTDTSLHRTPRFGGQTGTGFVWRDESGKDWVWTAYHVVSAMRSEHRALMAMFADMAVETPLTIVAYSAKRDIALLAFADPNFRFSGTPVEFGDSDAVVGGDAVIARGAPYGHAFFETHGNIIERYSDKSGRLFLRSNAKVDFGDSGGPLYDNAGKVIGVIVGRTEDIFSRFLSSSSVPANDIKVFLEKLRKAKKA